jgi:hypothetical protein
LTSRGEAANWHPLGSDEEKASGSSTVTTLMLSEIASRDQVELLSLCRGVGVSLYVLRGERATVIKAVVTYLVELESCAGCEGCRDRRGRRGGGSNVGDGEI